MFFWSNIRNITIPRSCKAIYNGAFICCVYLEEFFSESPEFIVNNKVLYSKDYKFLLGYPCNCNIELLPTVIGISETKGFSGTSFVNITINFPLKTILSYAFRCCPNLEYIDLSCTKVTAIYNAIFYESRKLKTVILPPLLRSIDIYCFCRTNIIELIIPPGVSYIVPNAFQETQITDIYYCGTNTFGSTSLARTDVKIHVSEYFSKSATKFLGCPIVDRTFTCPDYLCLNLIDQSFMDCPSMNSCIYSHFYPSILLYTVMIVM